VPTDRFSGRAACTTASSGVSPATSNEPPSSSNPFANVQARRPVTEQHTGPVQSLGEWGQGGDEAVENTIKIARYHTRRPGIVCFENAFHGRTFLTMAPTSKSLTGGLPLGAVTGTAEVMDAVHVGGLGGTFGGNPLACRAALAVLQIIEKEGVVGRATELGEGCPGSLGGVSAALRHHRRGAGPRRNAGSRAGQGPNNEDPGTNKAKRLTAFRRERGLVVLVCGTLGNNIRMLMPLTITHAEVARGLTILEEGLAHLSLAGAEDGRH
jgi:4-aminobutyrate aminotransferase-like enzyme